MTQKNEDKLLDFIEARLEFTYAYGLSALDWNRKEVANQILAKARTYYEARERKLRDLLWAIHSCDGKYCDDGEIQCGRFLPTIDFLRDEPEDIETKMPLHNAQLCEAKGLDRPDREKIAQKLYEKTKVFADLMYDMARQFNLSSNPRYDLWTTKWGDWDSLDGILKNLYRLEADQILVFIPDTDEAKIEEKLDD